MDVLEACMLNGSLDSWQSRQCLLRDEAALEEEAGGLSQWVWGVLVAVVSLVLLCCGSSGKAGGGDMDFAQ